MNQIPSGKTGAVQPVGITLVAPAFAELGGKIHALLSPSIGKDRLAIADTDTATPDTTTHFDLAVVGAHLTDMILEYQLTDRGGVLIEEAQTAGDYGLFAPAGPTPAKPGLVHTPGFDGPGIALEIWRLPLGAIGRFLTLIPAPLGLGTVTLSDGRQVSGFICEASAQDGATDITAFGGWKAYRARV